MINKKNWPFSPRELHQQLNHLNASYEFISNFLSLFVHFINSMLNFLRNHNEMRTNIDSFFFLLYFSFLSIFRSIFSGLIILLVISVGETEWRGINWFTHWISWHTVFWCKGTHPRTHIRAIVRRDTINVKISSRRINRGYSLVFFRTSCNMYLRFQSNFLLAGQMTRDVLLSVEAVASTF